MPRGSFGKFGQKKEKKRRFLGDFGNVDGF